MRSALRPRSGCPRQDEQSYSGGDSSGPSAPLGSLVANVGGRIQEMLDTAERVAREIRAEAAAATAAYPKGEVLRTRGA